jgi:hypothetical protein
MRAFFRALIERVASVADQAWVSLMNLAFS